MAAATMPIAFSTAPELRILAAANNRNSKSPTALLSNESDVATVFAVIEATEEAIYNSLFVATTTTGVVTRLRHCHRSHARDSQTP